MDVGGFREAPSAGITFSLPKEQGHPAGKCQNINERTQIKEHKQKTKAGAGLRFLFQFFFTFSKRYSCFTFGYFFLSTCPMNMA